MTAQQPCDDDLDEDADDDLDEDAEEDADDDLNGETKDPPRHPGPDPNLYCNLADVLDGLGPERDWFCEGVIEGISPLVVLAAPEKSGKSWMLADLAVATIAGTRWLGRFEIMRPGDVVLLDAECGVQETARRIARVARGHGCDPRDVLPHVRYVNAYWLLDQMDDDDWNAIRRDFNNERPALTIVDPLRGHMSGSEDCTKDMMAALQGALDFGRRGLCPVVIAHHVNKNGVIGGNRALRTTADLILTGTDEERPWYSAIGRRIRGADSIGGKRFRVEVQHEHDDDDSQARTMVVARFEDERTKPAGELSAPARRLLDELQREPRGLAVTDIRDRLSLNGPTRTKTLRELTDKGLIVQRGKRWTLATAPLLEGLAQRGASKSGDAPQNTPRTTEHHEDADEP